MADVQEVKWGSLPAYEITNKLKGSSMIVTLFGGTIVSFKNFKKIEKLFVSEVTKRDGTKAIRGGIPVVFPQFGPGRLPQHGFARTSVWKFMGFEVDNETVHFGLELKDDAKTLEVWPYPFDLQLKVSFGADWFKTDLKVTNTGNKEFRFQSLLHTYYLLPRVEDIAIIGLEDLKYINKNKPIGESLMVQNGQLKIKGEVDNIYKHPNSPRKIIITNGKEYNVHLELQLTNNTEYRPVDSVVWNPWEAKAIAMSDFGDHEYFNMVCVEPGCCSRYETCLPNEEWTLSQTITFK